VSAQEAFYEYRRPTIWQRLGFGRPAMPDMDDMEGAEGFVESHLIVSTVTTFGWRDRLRILLSGKVEVVQAVKTDALVRRTVARSNVAVLPPCG